MLALFISLLATALLLQKILTFTSSYRNKFLMVIGVSALILSLNIGLYLNTKEPNLYEQLGVGRMIPLKEMLRLLRANAELRSFYEEIQQGTYELRCLNMTDSSWLTDSFTFYGESLIAVNILSFTSPGSSRLVLFTILLALVAELLICFKYLTLGVLIYTSCEQIVVLRKTVPGVAFAMYFLGQLRAAFLIEKKEDFNELIKREDSDIHKLAELLKEKELDKEFTVTDFIEYDFDVEAKKKATPSKMKKIMKYVGIGILIYSVLKK